MKELSYNLNIHKTYAYCLRPKVYVPPGYSTAIISMHHLEMINPNPIRKLQTEVTGYKAAHVIQYYKGYIYHEDKANELKLQYNL